MSALKGKVDVHCRGMATCLSTRVSAALKLEDQTLDGAILRDKSKLETRGDDQSGELCCVAALSTPAPAPSLKICLQVYKAAQSAGGRFGTLAQPASNALRQRHVHACRGCRTAQENQQAKTAHTLDHEREQN